LGLERNSQGSAGFFISFLLSLPFRSQLRYLHHP
jgi:hypothetical protein